MTFSDRLQHDFLDRKAGRWAAHEGNRCQKSCRAVFGLSVGIASAERCDMSGIFGKTTALGGAIRGNARGLERPRFWAAAVRLPFIQNPLRW